MKTRTLGRHGPEISVVGFGAWEAGGPWGPPRPDEELIAAVRAGVDSGMTWVDTAEVYGSGRSEELIGRALEGREDVMVFTKLAPSASGFRSSDVRGGAESSLRRLRRDVIDLYQLHWPDDSVPIEETWEAMASLVDAGLVRYVGLSNFRRDQIDRCESIRHVDSLQSQYSLLVRRLEDELFPYCADRGIGVLCYGPLAYGLLTGRFDKSTTFGPDDWRGGGHGVSYYKYLFAPGVFEANIDRVERLRPIAERLGLSIAQVALAWITSRDWATAAIAGSTSENHTKQNAAAGGVDLSKSDLEEIDEIFPLAR